MYKINTSTNSIEKLEERLFSDLSFRERDHLQEWIAKNPESLNEELLIIQKEFSGFDDTNERLDLLALDKDGNLVVIENKLDDTGGDVVWQAIKYTSYCSTLTTLQIVNIYQNYISSNGSDEDARASIMEFLHIENNEELYLNRNDQRIIFVANNYRKEVTSTVLWLLEHDIQIQCFRATPHSMNDELFLQIEQIIPVPETKELMVGIGEKKKEGKKSEVVRKTEARLVKFWTQFKEEFSKSGHHHLDRITVAPRFYIGFTKGNAKFNFVIGRGGYRLELYFPKDEDKAYFNAMFKHKSQIESSIGESLIWQVLEGKKASRIKVEIEGHGNFDGEEWSEYFDWYIEAFDQFYPVVLPVLEKIQIELK